jgi:diguanylate cyclase (GGDEF)-like protein
LRREDIVARWEGAEFVVGIYGMTRQDGVNWLLEILQVLPLISIPSADENSIQITFSAGVAQYPEDGATVQSLYQTASVALEKTKLKNQEDAPSWLRLNLSCAD